MVYLVAQWVREGQVRVGDLVVWPRDVPAGTSAPSAAGADRVGTVERLYAENRSDVFVEVRGVVDRVLADDNEGSRHQRFILELGSGHTVLVAHNIDLAPRVPMGRGDRLELRGEYEWNERGGVLHWTHRDPKGRHEGGWIKFAGRTYR